jgi:hypothetical protein
MADLAGVGREGCVPIDRMGGVLILAVTADLQARNLTHLAIPSLGDHRRHTYRHEEPPPSLRRHPSNLMRVAAYVIDD